jgi:hypothetical protein
MDVIAHAVVEEIYRLSPTIQLAQQELEAFIKSIEEPLFARYDKAYGRRSLTETYG